MGVTVFAPIEEAAAACRGEWAEGNTYQAGDVVTYQGSTYTATQTHTACVGCGWNPVAAPSLWSKGGTCGTSPTPTVRPTATPRPTATVRPTATPRPTPTPTSSTSCGGAPAWNSTTVYTGGQRASYNGRLYEAKWWTQNNVPSSNSCTDCVWRDLGACSGGTNPTPTPTARPTPTPTPTTNPGTGFSSIVSESQFNQMFPNRNSFYTYQGLLRAASRYSAFAGTGDTAMRRREAAAAMANFHHETGGLVHITEIAQGEYCSGTSTPCGVCAAGKRYFGRGPIQLSWNYNYCAAGQALGLNLWGDPDMVSRDPAVAWSTALWFWMTQTGAGTSTAHNCIVNNQGFGCTIRTINGSVECGGRAPAQVQSRIDQFNRMKSILGTTSVGADGC